MNIYILFFSIYNSCVVGYLVELCLSRFVTDKIHTGFVCVCRDLAICSGTNGVVPASSSNIEVIPDNPKLLHKHVSEGNLHGVKSVYFAKTPFLVT